MEKSDRNFVHILCRNHKKEEVFDEVEQGFLKAGKKGDVKNIYLDFWGRIFELGKVDNLHKKSNENQWDHQREVNKIYFLIMGLRRLVEIKKQKSREALKIKGFGLFLHIYKRRKFLDRRAGLWYDIGINNAY